MKLCKALGKDNVTAEIIKYMGDNMGKILLGITNEVMKTKVVH